MIEFSQIPRSLVRGFFFYALIFIRVIICGEFELAFLSIVITRVSFNRKIAINTYIIFEKDKVPLNSVSIGFKDISLSFLRHPVTNDISTLRDEDAIKKSVMNLIRTQVGERFFNSLLGSNIEGSIFELATDDLLDPLQIEIETVINNFEPRVVLRKVEVNPRPDENALNISINYDIVGLGAPTQSINFVLQPTRY